MTKPTAGVLAGAAAAALAVIAVVATRPSLPPTADYVAVSATDAGAPAGAELTQYVVRASDSALAAFGLRPSLDAGPRGYLYLIVRICAPPRDGGQAPLPPGMDVVVATEQDLGACPAGAPTIRAWEATASNAAAAYGCACLDHRTCGGQYGRCARDGGTPAPCAEMEGSPGPCAPTCGPGVSGPCVP